MLSVAITTANQWLWSFVISRVTPYMITSLGYGVYMLFASLMVGMSLWAWWFVPETKGRSLEEMEEVFGVAKRRGEEEGRAVGEERDIGVNEKDGSGKPTSGHVEDSSTSKESI
ncbi:hypothetical protein TWF481_003998 [Arthrobotrys musiformis]|uniref:Major facilitator superfamily (MFS) profile domain-containing protein n=1 Tax=Arthrobotrys musiformis TaxID=47236 RepID=A0AAV9WIP3_9PEZI